jgi:outer membrane protein OmpA-like peptidoglycan-associated protein
LASLLRGIGLADAMGMISERDALSNQRAEVVRSMLLLAGVSPVLVSASGNPNSKPLDGGVVE